MPPRKRPRDGATSGASDASLITLSSDEFPSLRAEMVELWREGKLCDTEVCTSAGHSRHAHSLVLASASSFFRAFFTSDVGTDKSTVDIGEVSQGLIDPLLEFLYTSSCQVDQALLTEMMEVADRVGAPALRDAT